MPLYYTYLYEQCIEKYKIYMNMYSYKNDHMHKVLHIFDIHVCVYQIPIFSTFKIFFHGISKYPLLHQLKLRSVPQIISLFSLTSTKSRFRILGCYSWTRVWLWWPTARASRARPGLPNSSKSRWGRKMRPDLQLQWLFKQLEGFICNAVWPDLQL